MKKILVFALFTLTVVATQAQSNFHFGVKGGGLNTWILNQRINSSVSDTAYRVGFGFTGGVTASWYLNSRTYYSHNLKGIHFEAMYTAINQGYKKSPNAKSAISPFTAAQNLNYLDLALFFRTLPSSDNGVYFQIGPQLGILMGGRFRSDAIKDSAGNTLRPAFSGDINKDNYATTNLAAVMEIGKLFNSKSKEWSAIHVGLRVSYGFTDITNPQRDVLTGIGLPYYRNSVASIGLVIGWHYKGRNYYN